MNVERPDRDIDEALARALDAAGTPAPLRPMWPEVARRRARGFAPVFDLRFAMATAAAVSIGFLIGALTFDGTSERAGAVTETQTVASTDAADWTDAGPTLVDLYLLDDASTEASQ